MGRGRSKAAMAGANASGRSATFRVWGRPSIRGTACRTRRQETSNICP